MAVDFVSQSTVDARIELVVDALDHAGLAESILQKATMLPPGSVIGVMGAWGRGKTDVLLRIAERVRTPSSGLSPMNACKALWINPWQYGTPDLLTPLVIAMLEAMPAEARSGDKALRKAAESILRAGMNFGLKIASVAIPGAPLFGLAAEGIDKLFGGLFEALDKKEPSQRPDADPVAKMGERFKELVGALIGPEKMNAGARVLVCVDDLDRCLPDRQVAMLEAIRFLISAGAPATFLIALDPTLARQAILTHYRTEHFDPDRYLDKMFDLRVHLSSVGSDRVRKIVGDHLDREVRTDQGPVPLVGLLKAATGAEREQWLAAAPRALEVGDGVSPRLVKRIFDRLALFSFPGPERRLSIADEAGCRLMLRWLIVVERWPKLRHALQGGGAERVEERLRQAHTRTSTKDLISPDISAELKMLPDSPDLVEIIGVLARDLARPRAQLLWEIDDALVRAGL